VVEFPILVARWDKDHPADLAVCEDCGYERKWNPEDGDPYDLCIRHHGCGGQIVMKYDVGEACGNCGTLAYSHPVKRKMEGERYSRSFCNRACLLQAEYAEALSAR
jgi:hypothetical protein